MHRLFIISCYRQLTAGIFYFSVRGKLSVIRCFTGFFNMEAGEEVLIKRILIGFEAKLEFIFRCPIPISLYISHKKSYHINGYRIYVDIMTRKKLSSI